MHLLLLTGELELGIVLGDQLQPGVRRFLQVTRLRLHKKAAPGGNRPRYAGGRYDISEDSPVTARRTGAPRHFETGARGIMMATGCPSITTTTASRFPFVRKRIFAEEVACRRNVT